MIKVKYYWRKIKLNEAQELTQKSQTTTIPPIPRIRFNNFPEINENLPGTYRYTLRLD